MNSSTHTVLQRFIYLLREFLMEATYMARYIANIDQSYKQPIPYHFVCNYCGEITQTSYDITVSVKASGNARYLGAVREETKRQHDKQIQ